MTTKKYALIMTSLVLAACGAETPDAETRGAETPDIATRAQQIADSSLLIDTHIDVPMRLVRAPVNIAEHTEDGDFDYPRAVAGGLNVPFMSIYTSASLEEQGKSKEAADRLIDAVEKAVADAPDKFAIARSTADVERQFMEGLMSLPRHSLRHADAQPVESHFGLVVRRQPTLERPQRLRQGGRARDEPDRHDDRCQPRVGRGILAGH